MSPELSQPSATSENYESVKEEFLQMVENFLNSQCDPNNFEAIDLPTGELWVILSYHASYISTETFIVNLLDILSLYKDSAQAHNVLSNAIYHWVSHDLFCSGKELSKKVLHLLANVADVMPPPVSNRFKLLLIGKKQKTAGPSYEWWEQGGVITSTLSCSITKLDCIAFSAIPISEFLSFNKGQSPSLSRFAFRHSRLSAWVSTQILQTSLTQQYQAIEFMCQLAKSLIDLGNYQSASAVLAGLDQTSITRLKRPWKSVKQTLRDELDTSVSLLSPLSNYSEYRTLVQKRIAAGEPVLPLLPVVLRDLTYIYDAHDSVVDGKLNKDRILLTNVQLQSVATLQSQARNRIPNLQSSSHFFYDHYVEMIYANTTDGLLESGVRPLTLDEEKLYNLSISQHPLKKYHLLVDDSDASDTSSSPSMKHVKAAVSKKEQNSLLPSRTVSFLCESTLDALEENAPTTDRFPAGKFESGPLPTTNNSTSEEMSSGLSYSIYEDGKSETTSVIFSDCHSWTTPTLTKWSETIGIPEFKPVVLFRRLDGSCLKNLSVETLQKYGLSPTQAQSIMQHVTQLLEDHDSQGARNESLQKYKDAKRKKKKEKRKEPRRVASKRSLKEDSPTTLCIDSTATVTIKAQLSRTKTVKIGSYEARSLTMKQLRKDIEKKAKLHVSSRSPLSCQYKSSQYLLQTDASLFELLKILPNNAESSILIDL